MATSYTLPTLNSNQEYYWQVKVRNAQGSASSVIMNFTSKEVVVLTAPDVVTSMLPANNATGFISGDTISWAFSANTDEYQVLFDSVNPPVTEVVPWTSDLQSYHVVPTVTNNAFRYWQVNVRNAYGTTTGPIFTLRAANPANRPSAPYALTPSNGTTGVENGVEIGGTYTFGVQAWSLYLDTVTPPLQKVVDSEATGQGVKRYTLTGLIPNTTYYWYLAAENNIGTNVTGISSFVSSADVVLLAPGVPTSLTPANNATGILNGSQLNWAFGSDTTQFRLLFGTAETPVTPVIDWTSSLQTSFNLPPLVHDTAYYWRVVARNITGDTASDIMKFTATVPVSTTLTITEENVEYLPDKRASILVTVTPDGEDVFVELQLSDSPDFSSPTITEIEVVPASEIIVGTVVTINLDLQPIGVKYARIRGYDDIGEVYSSTMEIHTLPGTGRDRTLTDYSAALQSSRDSYTGTTYYIDPTIAVSGNGLTPETAYKSWSNIGWYNSARRFLQKSGTVDTAFTSIYNYPTYIGTYGGTERATVRLNYSTNMMVPNSTMMIENMVFENTYRDADGQPDGNCIRMRNSAGSWIHNCEIKG